MFGVALDDEGIFRLNFKHPTFIATSFVVAMLFSVFMYLLISTLSTNDSSWDLEQLGHVTVMGLTIFSAPSCSLAVALMLVKIGDHKMIADCKVPASKICMMILYVVFVLAGVSLEANTYMINVTPVQDTITVLVLIVAFVQIVTCALTWSLVLFSLKNSFEKILKIKDLDIKDIAHALDIFERGKQSLQLIGFEYFSLILPFIIIVIFLVITSDKVIGPILCCFATLYFVTNFTLEMEKVYGLVQDIVTKGRSDAFEKSSTLRDLLKMQISVDELEASGPLTGYGFFIIEKSTLTTMLSHLLTYLIILMQMNSA